MTRTLSIIFTLTLFGCALPDPSTEDPVGDPPLLATLDDGDWAWRLDYHEQVIAKQGLSYIVGDTEASHRDLAQLTGLIKPDKAQRAPRGQLAKSVLPDRWDWRDHAAAGSLSPIRNQGSCGSCWAFGTAGVLEQAIAIYGGEITDLSEQYLVDCNNDGYGCGGGYWVYDYFENPGAMMESDYPYVGYDQSCLAGSKPHPYTIQSSYSVASDVTAMKEAIYQHGALGVTMNVCGSIPGYSGGVYDSTECNYGQTNHIVVLVGWDDTVTHDLGSGVWIMRNSWGTNWGESGYMRMAYGTAQIEEDPTYVVYIDPVDTDDDGLPDAADNCPELANPDQADADLDGTGDACDGTFDPTEQSLSLGDDDSKQVALGFSFPFYGQNYSEVHVNSDGNLTFTSPDAESGDRSTTRFLTGPPRIGLLFADLNPAGGGQILYRKDNPTALTVRYQGVPEYGASNSNTVAVTINASGRIRIEVTGVATSTSIVGVTKGGSGNAASETDLSAVAGSTIAYTGTTAIFEAFDQSGPCDLTGKVLNFAETGEPNQPPTAAIEATPRSGNAPLEVTFTGTGTDSDGTVVGYSWDFGDGTSSAEQNPVKVYQTEGGYTVTLTVTDDAGDTGVAHTTIGVGQAPPDNPDDPDDPDNPDDPDDPDGPGADDPRIVQGGCAIGGSDSTDAWWLMLVGLLAIRRRRQ